MFSDGKKKPYWVIKLNNAHICVSGSSAHAVGPMWEEEHRHIVNQSADPMRDWLAHLDRTGEFIERTMKENAEKKEAKK